MSDYKPKKNHPNALKYRKDIENAVRKGIKNGATIKQILDRISHMQEAPQSANGLYKIYGPVIEEERANFADYVGGAIRQKIQEGDSKIIEFTARSKLGWNPSIKIEETDAGEEDEDKDAVSRLAALLGRDEDDPT